MCPFATLRSVSGCILISAAILLLATQPVDAQNSFTVTVEFKTADHPYFGQGDPEGYLVDGVEGAELTLERGETYTFQMSNVSPLHPFYISTSSSGAGAGIWNEGVKGNFAIGDDTLTFTVPSSAPDELWYQCAAHLFMGWRINVVDGDSETFAATLSGGQEVPANASRASGSLSAALTGSTLVVTGSFEGLGSDYIGSHLHLGYAGQNGPVTVGLSPQLSGDNRSGTFQAAENTFELSSDQAAALMERRIYVNVHSIEMPGGEIRGQLLNEDAPAFHAVLSGRAEIPANPSQGSGAVVVDLSGVSPVILTLTGAFSGLESDYHVAIGSHIHEGAVHENGPVIIDLVPDLDGDLRGGVFTAASNTFELTGDQMTALTAGELYVNVHTEDLPPGELRGQLFLLGTQIFEARIVGDHETPPVVTAAHGGAIANLLGATLRLGGSFGGLGSDYTASHIHIGEVGTSGGVVLGLNAVLDGDNRGGVYMVDDNAFVLTGDQLDALYDAGYYVNIHSVDQPPGEIRGQLLVTTNLAPEPATITAPGDGATVLIKGDPDETLLVEWDAFDPNANPVAFSWQLASDPEFENVLLEEQTGLETSAAITYAVLDDILADLDVNHGQSVTLHHRAVSSDGGFLTAGTGASVTVERGAVSGEDEAGPPAAFSVSGPAPNPFSSVTTLRIDLPTSAETTVTLFDLLGRRVAEYRLGFLQAGPDHRVRIEGDGLAAGVYIIRVEVGAPGEVLVASGRIVRIP